MENKELPYQAKEAINYIQELVKDYESRIEKLTKEFQVVTNIQKVQELLPYNILSKECANIRDFNASRDYSSWNYSDRIPELEKVNKMMAEDTEIKNKNDKIVKENLDNFNTVVATLKRFGLQEVKYVKISSRSYKEKKVESEWLSELRGKMNIYDCSSYNVESHYKRFFEEYKKYQDKEADKIQKQNAEIAAKKKQQEENVALGMLIVKYKLPTNVIYSADEIISELLKQDKYLTLAHYMSKNRGDWSDGARYVNHGLSLFTVENLLDQEIYDDVSSYLEDFEDGRVFRDCSWNYDRIFAFVKETKPELYVDYCSLLSYV